MTKASPIRILHVTEASNAGVGGHALDLMEGLPKLGHGVHFAYSPLRLDDFFRGRLESIPKNSLSQILMRRNPHWSDLQAIRQLKKCVAEHGPFDIIHAHSTKAGGICRTRGIRQLAKIVYTPNGIFSMNPCSNPIARRLVRMAETALARRSDAIIAVSPEEHEHMLEIGISDDRIRMIPNGLRKIDWPDRETVRIRLGFHQDDLIFGYLGRLASQKNPLLLIRAFAMAAFADPRVKLAMVGTGPLEESCKQLALDLGIADRITWLGFKTAPQSMPAFDVFVMPSRYEGMPYVMMEAISLGLPVIATRVGGTSLGIEQGVNGIVVPLDAEDELADALKTVENADVRKEMSDAALIKSKEFDVGLMVERTVEVYNVVLGRKNQMRLESKQKALAPHLEKAEV